MRKIHLLKYHLKYLFKKLSKAGRGKGGKRSFNRGALLGQSSSGAKGDIEGDQNMTVFKQFTIHIKGIVKVFRVVSERGLK